jgi:acetoin utilization deacetylase AcuC-like enzyme
MIKAPRFHIFRSIISQITIVLLVIAMIFRVVTTSQLSKTSSKMTSSTAHVPTPKSAILYYNDIYHVTMPENHRFPMDKYRLVRQYLQSQLAHHPQVKFLVSPLATIDELSLTHCPKYVLNYISGNMTAQQVRKTGFPWSKEHVYRSLSSVGGTLAATRQVLSNDSIPAACHIAGGTHHAFYDYGEGFCIFSDIAVAANIAVREFHVDKILIVDLDVHQGNGNAVLFRENPNVVTFSMHCQGNYFSTKQISDYDVELPVDTTDDQYMKLLEDWLPHIMSIVKPSLVFYQAGVDILEDDRLGKLKVSLDGIRRRNEYVYQYMRKHNVKTVVTMGGGYPKDFNPDSIPFQHIIQAHASCYLQCVKIMLDREN